MSSSIATFQRIAAGAAFLAAGGLSAAAAWAADAAQHDGESLAQRIFETMQQVPGARPGFRLAHPKGIVCEGTFSPSKGAATLSKAAHLQGGSVPVTVRFSNDGADPFVPDNSPNGAGPRGMAIRFKLPGGGETDLVSFSHNGFPVATGEEFLALQQAVVA